VDLANIAAALLRWETDKLAKGLKRRWLEWTLSQEAHYSGGGDRFDRLYLVRDPWSLDRKIERLRFRETNNIISKHFGRCPSLLEVGCGEGLQSHELQKICDRLHGIDVSARAVRRARSRCPQGIFTVSDIYALPHSMQTNRFDLVTACEVLYYMSDVPRALRRVSELGRACLVSYYNGARDILDKNIREIPGVQCDVISEQEFSWTVAWWQT
jgi:SAM-dependent methyltransferase